MNLKDKTVLVYDYGLFSSQAIRLAKDFGKVQLFVPWASAHPDTISSDIGTGLEGIERVRTFWDHVEHADLICAFDTNCWDIVEYLRAQGHRVFGAGAAEWMETNRMRMRKAQKEWGLAVQHTIPITGLSNLRAHTADPQMKNRYIKLDTFRGAMESFKHVNEALTKPVLDHLAQVLGPRQESMKFTSEEFIEGVEPGFDGLVVDGRYAKRCLWGPEAKDQGYLGKVVSYDEVPGPLKVVTDTIAPEFQRLKTRSFASFEVRVTPKGESFLIDPTIRCATPGPCEVQSEMMTNYSEVVWAAAGGESVDPIFSHPYAGALMMKSAFATGNWLALDIPKDVRPFVKIRMGARFGETFYSVPGNEEILVVIGMGKSPDEVIEHIGRVADEIQGVQLVGNVDVLKTLNEKVSADAKPFKLPWP